MKLLKNEKGIALVLVLILALISLAIVSAMLFMLTGSTQLSGAQRFYRTADEASIGGTEIFTEFIKNRGAALTAGLTNSWRTADNCLTEKMTKSRADWDSAKCTAPETSLSIDDTNNLTYDVSFTLGNNPSFSVFGKIVDAVEGNSDTGGLVTGGGELGGAGVVAANSGLVSPPHQPFLYRLEVQGQATANPRERARLSVLYAY